MNDHDRFWERVDAALDERRDPLDDVEIQQLAAERPELLDELARLQARLAHLPTASRKRITRRVASFAAAALVVTLAVIAFAISRRHDDTDPNASLAPAPTAIADPSRVLSFRAEVVIEDANGRTTTVFDGERLVRTRETFAKRSPTDDPATPTFVAVVQSSSFVR